jgi:hypothetical protein
MQRTRSNQRAQRPATVGCVSPERAQTLTHGGYLVHSVLIFDEAMHFVEEDVLEAIARQERLDDVLCMPQDKRSLREQNDVNVRRRIRGKPQHFVSVSGAEWCTANELKFELLAHQRN